jgi:dTDP-4-amino-4,6-dideoxygalactose transaminase
MNRVPFVNLAAQAGLVRQEIAAAIEGVLQRGDYILGHALEEFEQAFAAYCGAGHAIGVDNGLAAIELILRGYGIGAGDEVIANANTFHSSVLPIVCVGARPVLVEPDARSFNLDPELVEAAITPRTKAIIAVHLYGQPADLDPLMAIAERHGLKLIEDSAQAHGARYKGRRTGSLGHAAAFSFYPTKNLGAYGDGGAVVTSDDALAERLRMLRNLGQKTRNHHELLGYNHRLDTLQAAILSVNLTRLDEWNAQRQTAAAWYAEALAELPLVTPYVAPEAEHVYHLYVVRVQDRAALQAHLAAAGVASAVHYPVPIHLQPAFAGLGYRRGDFPLAEALCDEILSLPMYPGLGEQEIDAVAAALRQFATRQLVAA